MQENSYGNQSQLMELDDKSTPSSIAQQNLAFAGQIQRKVLQGQNKNEYLLKRHLQVLNEELSVTKKNIVRHILQSRALERTKAQVLSSHLTLQHHLLERLQPQILANQERLRLAREQNFKVLFDNDLLLIIDSFIGWNYPGLTPLIAKTIFDYSDKEFLQYLKSIPNNLLPITEAIFQQITINASCGFITSMEASAIFASIPAPSPDGVTAQEHWMKLQQLLCRRLTLQNIVSKAMPYIYNIESKFKSQQPFHYSLSSLSSDNNSTTENFDGVSFRSGSAVSISSLSSKHPRKNKPKATNDRANKTTSLSSSSLNGIANSKNCLVAELNRSQAKRDNLKEKMIADMSQFLSNNIDTLSSGDKSQTLKSNPAIRDYFRKTSTQKWEKIFRNLGLKIFKRAFDRWQNVCKVIRVTKNCKVIIKNIATSRLFRVFEWRIVLSLFHVFSKWKKVMEFYDVEEKLSAVLDIQRCYRGHLKRKQLKIEATLRAAQTTQKALRVFIAKRAGRRMLRNMLMKRSVRRIEKQWKSFQWIRAIKKAFRFKKQLKCALLIQRVFRGHLGRKRCEMFRAKRRAFLGCLKFQCVWRRYQAILRVEKIRINLRRKISAMHLQRIVRGVQARAKFKKRWHIYYNCRVIQCAWRCCRARRELKRRVRWRAAIRIQCVARGRQGRKRFAIIQAKYFVDLERRHKCATIISALIRGWLTMRRMRVPLQQHLQRRKRAARILQYGIKAIHMGHVSKLLVQQRREELAQQRRLNEAAIRIQKIVRGKIVKYKIQRRIAERAEEERLKRLKVPYYYRLRESYYLSQELMYRKKVIKIQTLARQYISRRRLRRKKIDVKATIIQNFFIDVKMIQEAKSVKLSLKTARDRKWLFAIVIQKVIRGFLARARVTKAKSVKVLLYAAKEKILRRKIKKGMLKYRLRRQEERRVMAQVIRIQAWARSRLTLRWYRKNYRSLVRQRAIRGRARRDKAASVIQRGFRCYRARVRVARQRVLMADLVKERRELEELEKSLEGLHDVFITELLAIRAQTGVRGMLARIEFAKKVDEYKLKVELDKRAALNKAAAKVQALARGVLARARYKKALPQLKKAFKQRQLCVECEITLASRRCRDCKDKYCVDCYDLMHQKGHRKNHRWENIVIDPRILAMSVEESNASKRKKSGVEKTTLKGNKGASKVNPKDWEEFYDASAKAKYWYNKITGEASWINPFN